MQKTCPECQKTFECSQSEDCWCTRITIPDDVANYLRSKYFDCLCEDCMTKILKNKEKILAGK
ncbi:MAG: cysteine-rich CWC family protein [Bacteroidales bacterium]|nr:cysteine-rich CWC family protein [Bacteroidales bacterium]